MGLLTKNDITWVSAVSESPFIAGFFPKPTFQKKAQTSKNRAHQNEFTAKDDAFLSGEACFFFVSVFVFGYRIFQQFWGSTKNAVESSLGIYPKLPTSTLAKQSDLWDW